MLPLTPKMNRSITRNNLNPLPDDKILGLLKLKPFADDKLLNVTQNVKIVFHRIENIVG